MSPGASCWLQCGIVQQIPCATAAFSIHAAETNMAPDSTQSVSTCTHAATQSSLTTRSLPRWKGRVLTCSMAWLAKAASRIFLQLLQASGVVGRCVTSFKQHENVWVLTLSILSLAGAFPPPPFSPILFFFPPLLSPYSSPPHPTFSIPSHLVHTSAFLDCTPHSTTPHAASRRGLQNSVPYHLRTLCIIMGHFPCEPALIQMPPNHRHHRHGTQRRRPLRLVSVL